MAHPILPSNVSISSPGLYSSSVWCRMMWLLAMQSSLQYLHTGSCRPPTDIERRFHTRGSPPFWQINHAISAYFRLFLGYFWVISAIRPPPFWISASPFYISWIRPCRPLIPPHVMVSPAMERQLGVFGVLADHTRGNKCKQNVPMIFAHMHVLF